MFTGLVQEVGLVTAVRRQGQGVELRVEAELAPEVAVGDSVAIDGACQTATEVRDKSFGFFAMRETCARTTLGELRVGGRVHLELAMRAGDRFGGHLVQGHVDGVAKVKSMEKRGDSTRLDFELPEALCPYVIPQGSIAINGVSLTVVETEGNSFWVAIIPQTGTETRLLHLRKGDRVNIEVDVLARYVERLLGSRGHTGDTPPKPSGGLDLRKMREAGF